MSASPVVHLELHTGDLERASAFYAACCGWIPQAIETAHGAYHSMGLGRGIVRCATRRPVWLPYVEVDDVAQAAERARALGATVLLEPRAGPAGWRSVVTAGAGGEVAFWQPRERA